MARIPTVGGIACATPLFERAVELYQHSAQIGLAEGKDVAGMIDVLNDIPRKKH